MSDEGHEVGNRGYTGRAFSALPANTIMSNVMETSDILHNITGKQNTIQNTEYKMIFSLLFLYFTLLTYILFFALFDLLLFSISTKKIVTLVSVKFFHPFFLQCFYNFYLIQY